MRVRKDDFEYIESFWNGRKRVFYKDKECFKNENGKYEYINEDEKEEIEITGNLFSGVKAIFKENEVVLVDKIKIYEYLLSLSFLFLIIYKGNYIVSATIASIFAIVNMIVVRGFKKAYQKIIITIIVLAVSFLILLLVLYLYNLFSKGE